MPQGALLIGIGPLLVIVGVLAKTGRLRQNPLVGLRTRATFASEEAWAAAHRAAAWSFFVAGAIAVAGGVMAIVEDSDPQTRAAWIVIAAVFMIGVVGVGAIQGNRAARQVEERHESVSIVGVSSLLDKKRR